VRVRISWPNDGLTAELADTPNTAVLKDVLPVEGTAKTWGEEVYFSIPVSARLSTPARCASGATAGPRPAVRPDTDLAGQRVPAGQRVQHPRHHRRRSATAWSRSRAATRSGSSMQTEPPPAPRRFSPVLVPVGILLSSTSAHLRDGAWIDGGVTRTVLVVTDRVRLAALSRVQGANVHLNVRTRR
jgi:hypothetical protein